MEPNNEKREKLKEFYYRIKNCRSCELGGTRINFVFGSGNANASILFIGEAPGKNEDLQGRPFVGQAGKILDGLLAGIGLLRNEVFIANVLKCRPPENRDPAIDEINECKQYLFEQIEIIDPVVICTLGKYSTQLILNTTEGITKLRGNLFKINGRLVLPINHPAAVLYAPSRISVLKEDFNRIKSVLDKSVLDKSTIDKAVPDKAVVPGMALETGKVPEVNAAKKSTLADTNESGLFYTEQQENASIYSDTKKNREEQTGFGNKEDRDEKIGFADRNVKDGPERFAGVPGSDENARFAGREVKDEKADGIEEQADKNQQLGLF